MLPQLLAPLFGIAMGEAALINYASFCQSSIPPAFISLGGGQGFLDYDLIEYVTSSSFLDLPENLLPHGSAINHESKFLILDRGTFWNSICK